MTLRKVKKKFLIIQKKIFAILILYQIKKKQRLRVQVQEKQINLKKI